MRSISIIAAVALLLCGSGAAIAASPPGSAVTGAFLLGNAHRWGVADDRVVRAGRVIRELIAAAPVDAGEQPAAKPRFVEIFREGAHPEGSGRMPIPPCRTVV